MHKTSSHSLIEVPGVQREFHRWFSGALGRDMELLTYTADGPPRGLPVLVLPTSCGRFHQFEDHGMVHALSRHIEQGSLQLFCADSVDAESWYNRDVPPRWRIARHMQYERYLLEDVLPLMRARSGEERVVVAGCSMGGYHATNLALRRPDLFRGLLAMSAIFDPARFLGGYTDQDVYFHSPALFLPALHDPWHFRHYHQSTFVLAVGEHDICRGANEHMAALMRHQSLPVRFDIWGDRAIHDWPVWQKMVEHYL